MVASRFLGVLALVLALIASAPAHANDISNSTWSETAASNTGSPPNGWPSGVVTPTQVSPMMRETMAAIKRFYNRVNSVKTSAGTANVQTLTYDVAPAAYVAGDGYTFTAGVTNTGATTLNVNALGAKAVKIGTAALVGGELFTGRVVQVYYDGTAFQLVSSPLSVASTAVATTARGIFSGDGYPQNLFSVTDSTSAGIPGFNQAAVIGTEFDLTVPAGGVITAALHTSLVATAKLTGAKTYAAGGELESVMGAFFTADASASCGGAVFPGTSACKVYGGAVAGVLSSGATGYNAVTGLEVDAAIYAGASADYRVGLLVADLNSAVRGTVFDAAIDIGSVPGGLGSVGFYYGLNFSGGITGASGVSTDGTLIGASRIMSVANLIDFSLVGCTGSALLLLHGAWNCDGRLLLESDVLTPTLSVNTTGLADAMINIRNSTGGNQTLINFIDGVSTTKWSIGKGADNSWYAKDFNNNENWQFVTAGGIVTIGEAAAGAGNQLVLTRTGAASLTNMPTSAGAGGLYVCADTAGALYRKATCP